MWLLVCSRNCEFTITITNHNSQSQSQTATITTITFRTFLSPPERKPVPLRHHPLPFFGVSLHVFILEVSYKQNYTIHSPLWL